MGGRGSYLCYRIFSLSEISQCGTNGFSLHRVYETGTVWEENFFVKEKLFQGFWRSRLTQEPTPILPGEGAGKY